MQMGWVIQTPGDYRELVS